MWYKNIAGRLFGLVTKHACDRWTDRQMDRQNYDSQYCASIAASRGKKQYKTQYKCNQTSQSYTDSAAKIHLDSKTDTVYLWPPYGIGQTIIFLPCGFFLLFFSPNLSVALMRI